MKQQIDTSKLDPKKLAQKVLLETELLSHARYFFKKQNGFKFTVSAFHHKVTAALEKVLNGETKNLLILMPPRHSKTELVKYFCTMGFARNPASEFIYASSDLGLALNCSSEIRNTIAMPEFKERFDIRISGDTSAKGLWKTKQGGSFWAGGFGSPIVGYGAGKMQEALKKCQYKFGGAVIVDDPLKEQDRHNALVKINMVDFFKKILPTRKNSPNTPVVVIMQPLHQEDLGQWIKKNRSDKFEILELPIIDNDNQPLFPENYGIEDIRELEHELGTEMFQAKCMLNPIKLGGNILKTKHLKRYKMLPFMKHRWCEADTAQKVEEKHDYTVFQCWGKGYDGGIYLIDQFRCKLPYNELKPRFKDFWNKHNSVENYDPRQYGYLTTFYVEDKSSGTQIIQEAQAEGSIPVHAVQRGKGQGKYERAVNVALPKLEAGYIHLPEDAPWVSDLIGEMETFTGKEDSKQAIEKMEKKKTWDDQVDCLISACEHGFMEYVSNSDIVNKFREKKNKRRR